MRRIKYGIAIVLSLFILLCLCNIISLIAPLTSADKTEEMQTFYNELGIKYSDISEQSVTRREFLDILLRTIGMTDEILEQCKGVDTYPPTDDFSVEGPLSDDETDKLINDFYLLLIARDCGVLQVYNVDDSDTFRGKFLGDNAVTVKEAAVMIQACLDEDSPAYGFFKDSDMFKQLYADSRSCGIIKPADSIYWSALDTELTEKNMYILLFRLLQKPRYKYFNLRSEYWLGIETDKDRTMTYREFLENKYNIL